MLIDYVKGLSLGLVYATIVMFILYHIKTLVLLAVSYTMTSIIFGIIVMPILILGFLSEKHPWIKTVGQCILVLFILWGLISVFIESPGIVMYFSLIFYIVYLIESKEK